MHICEREVVKFGPAALDTLAKLSKGDMRCAVTMLQTACSFYGEVTEEGYSGQETLERVLDMIADDTTIPDVRKAKCSLLFSQVEERLAHGCVEDTQLIY